MRGLILVEEAPASSLRGPKRKNNRHRKGRRGPRRERLEGGRDLSWFSSVCMYLRATGKGAKETRCLARDICRRINFSSARQGPRVGEKEEDLATKIRDYAAPAGTRLRPGDSSREEVLISGETPDERYCRARVVNA